MGQRGDENMANAMNPRARRVWRRRLLLAGALALAVLAAACAGRGTVRSLAPASLPAAPIALSYPYLTAREANVPGYREMAERAAHAYVRVVIVNPGGGLYNEAAGVVIKASGVIVDRQGHIVTAAHIARSAKFTARVTTSDGREHKAEILHVAPDRELALLRVAPYPGMRPARFARPGTLRAGDLAFAIGSPRDTAGVVSLGWVRQPRFGQRLDYNDWGFDDAVKIKMEVESGHSGGPVFNRAGEVIGMVAVYELGDTSRTPYVSPRVTYAVPASDVLAYVRAQTGR